MNIKAPLEIADWETCLSPETDVCSSSSFGCCVAPADILTNKFTCRPLNDPSQCSSTPPILEIADWETCLSPDTDVCSSSSFGCCVAPSDVLTMKSTCRPKNVASQCYSPSPSLEISDWGTCSAPTTDVCSSSSFGCCVAPADVLTNKFTCRPLNDPSQCIAVPEPIADDGVCSAPTTDVCATSTFSCCVAVDATLANIFTCRDPSECVVVPEPIADDAVCPAPTTDVCATSTFSCCLGPNNVVACLDPTSLDPSAGCF